MNETLHQSDNTGRYQSLLGHLNPSPRGGLYLKLPFMRTETEPKGKGEAPLALEQAGPLADLMEAAIALDEQRPMADLFLLFQADIPRIGGGELEGLTNGDIEARWQEALSKADQPAVNLCRQNQQGQWQACQPLFACSHRSLFFHPPCPKCGGDLTLCRDDQFLAQAGLPAYSTSLNRYLYCNQCGRTDPVFYIKNRSGEPQAGIVESKDLIEQFSQLLARSDAAEKLPCIGCEDAGHCYGPENLVFERLAAVRFYPFYLLSQPAKTINALDFIALLAGADANRLDDELGAQAKTMRRKGLRRTQVALAGSSGFLFAGDPRHFAELLYLKLTFLRSLMDLYVAQPGPLTQVAREMSLDGVWVQLPEKSHHLPLFWNFGLCCVDRVGVPAGPSSGDTLDRVQMRLFLGRSWFYVLLANDRQPFSEVLNALGRFTAEPEKKDELLGEALFDPQHLFHGPSMPSIEGHWLPFWRRAVELGLAFFQADADQGQAGPVGDLAQDLDQLCGDLHQALFSLPAGAIQEAPLESSQTLVQPMERPTDEMAGQSADQSIKAILETILAKWPQASDLPETGSAKRPPEIQVDEDGDVEETVILTDTAAFGGAADQSASPAAADLDKTIVLQPSGDSPAKASSLSQAIEKTVLVTPGQDRGQADQGLEKTVILGQPGPPPQGDDLEKTVHISPEARQQPGGSQPPPVPPTQTRDDELEQTIIQASGSKEPPGAPSVRPRSPDGNGEDDLDATVIIDPSNQKNQKNQKNRKR